MRAHVLDQLLLATSHPHDAVTLADLRRSTEAAVPPPRDLDPLIRGILAARRHARRAGFGVTLCLVLAVLAVVDGPATVSPLLAPPGPAVLTGLVVVTLLAAAVWLRGRRDEALAVWRRLMAELVSAWG